MSRDLLAGLLPTGDPFAPFDSALHVNGRTKKSSAASADQSGSKRRSVASPETSSQGKDVGGSATSLAEAQAASPLAGATLVGATLVGATLVSPPVAEPGTTVEESAPPPPQVGPATVAVPEMGIPIPFAAEVVVPKRTSKARRRRKRSFAGPLMAAFALFLFSGIIGCLYLLIRGQSLTTDGRILANQSQNGENATPKTDMNGQPDVAERPPRDPVMAGGSRDIAGNPSRQPNPNGFQSDFGMPEQGMPEQGMNEPEPLIPSPATPEPDMSEPDLPEPGIPESDVPASVMPAADVPAPDMPAPDMAEPSEPEMAMADDQSGEKALEELESVLRGGQFAGMQAAIDTCRALMITDTQRQQLAEYALLVELADYYVEGIRRGAAGLGVAETFDITPGLTVAVVEGTREKLALKVNGQVKSYQFDELPLVLAHRLTKFSLPEDSLEVEAGRAAFQALWSRAGTSHRQQALDWVDRPKHDSDRFDVKSIHSAIKNLFDL